MLQESKFRNLLIYNNEFGESIFYGSPNIPKNLISYYMQFATTLNAISSSCKIQMSNHSKFWLSGIGKCLIRLYKYIELNDKLYLKHESAHLKIFSDCMRDIKKYDEEIWKKFRRELLRGKEIFNYESLSP